MSIVVYSGKHWTIGKPKPFALPLIEQIDSSDNLEVDYRMRYEPPKRPRRATTYRRLSLLKCSKN